MANPTSGSSTPYYGQPVNIGKFTNVTTQTAGVQIKSGEGALYSITFNKPTATTVVTLYDGTSTSGTVIGTITVPASPQPLTLFYDIYFATGLFLAMATADSDITLSYR